MGRRRMSRWMVELRVRQGNKIKYACVELDVEGQRQSTIPETLTKIGNMARRRKEKGLRRWQRQKMMWDSSSSKKHDHAGRDAIYG